MGHWADGDHGLVLLPSRRPVRARELSGHALAGQLPEFGVCLSPVDWRPFEWPAQWLPWHFWLPADRSQAAASLREVWRCCVDRRVELASWPAREQAGTALACLAVLDGASTADAVRQIKEQLEHWTVATPWQRRFISGFAMSVD